MFVLTETPFSLLAMKKLLVLYICSRTVVAIQHFCRCRDFVNFCGYNFRFSILNASVHWVKKALLYCIDMFSRPTEQIMTLGTDTNLL